MNENYPAYFKSHNGVLVAITDKDKCYVLRPVGSNSGNNGMTLDHYTTRRKVIEYYECGKQLSQVEYRSEFARIYHRYLSHIINQSII